MREETDRRLTAQRGFTLLETMVAVAIAAVAVVAVTALHGTQPPACRAAALALQGALAEARALAAADAGASGAAPTGATLTVSPSANGRTTRVAVFASRPIAGSPPLVADAGFPPLTLPVTISLAGGPAGRPFTIFVSSSGYASVAANFAYDPAQPRSLAIDPGCDEATGVGITVADDVASETHPFACRGATYDANASFASGGVRGP